MNTFFRPLMLGIKITVLVILVCGLLVAYHFKGSFLPDIFYVSKLFGASLPSIAPQPPIAGKSHNNQIKQMPVAPAQLNNKVADAVVAPPLTTKPQDTQDQADDILEKIDLLKRQIADATQNTTPDTPDIKLADDAKTIDTASHQDQLPDNLSATNTSNGGGANSIVYPKILISEVQIAGVGDAK